MYQGFCFREVFADAAAVGGYLRGSIGVSIYIYTCCESILYIYQFHSISFFRGSNEKGTLSKACTSHECSGLTGTLEVQGYMCTIMLCCCTTFTLSTVPNRKVSCCWCESDHMKRKTQSVYEYIDMIGTIHDLPVFDQLLFYGKPSDKINYYRRHLLWYVVQ